MFVRRDTDRVGLNANLRSVQPPDRGSAAFHSAGLSFPLACDVPPRRRKARAGGKEREAGARDEARNGIDCTGRKPHQGGTPCVSIVAAFRVVRGTSAHTGGDRAARWAGNGQGRCFRAFLHVALSVPSLILEVGDEAHRVGHLGGDTEMMGGKLQASYWSPASPPRVARPA